MYGRRRFVAHAVVGLAAAATSQLATPHLAWAASTPQRDSGNRPRIKQLIRREDTILRLGGDGDNFHMSWANDDRQYVALCDGMGFSGTPTDVYNSRLYALSGDPQNARFHEIENYPLKSLWLLGQGKTTGYYNFGTLALEGHIYQFLWSGASVKLIYSPDSGRTWCNQDGSTPVVWEPAERQSRKTMVFHQESQEAFTLLSILQMGRGYSANRDGYVYVYSPNGWTEGTMNELVMFRAPKAQILNRKAYEYFAGLRSDGSVKWDTDIQLRAVVHRFPSGWVNPPSDTGHPYAWHPSVVYNAPLGLYLMVNWGMGSTPETNMFGKPSYLGFWSAPNPWGPWTQIHEETAWMPENDPAARCYQPQIAPKWIAPDGKSFWLVWTDFQHRKPHESISKAAHNAANHDEFMRLWLQAERYRPFYAFNTQRVDIIVA